MFRVEEEVRGAWTLKCIAGTWDTEGVWRPAMCSGILIGTTDTHVSHLPVIREMTHFGRGELTSQVLEESRFLSISQKSSNSHG